MQKPKRRTGNRKLIWRGLKTLQKLTQLSYNNILLGRLTFYFAVESYGSCVQLPVSHAWSIGIVYRYNMLY